MTDLSGLIPAGGRDSRSGTHLIGEALCPDTAAARMEDAWAWLCQSRENAPDHADIWHLRHHWSQTKDALMTELLAGRYRLTPMLVTGKRRKEAQVMWSAQDALVLRWVALVVQPQLNLPARCEHIKGHGGGPSSVRRMSEALASGEYPYVCRTDVKGYYGSMNKKKLLACVYRQVHQPVLRQLIDQFVHYTVEDGGEFYTPDKGIARGCALSPLMGALYLAEMDEYFSKKGGIYYARYMDDVVILAKTRWQLRRHVKALNDFFNAGDVTQHPDKTFIGKTERGFDWMGAQLGERGVEGIARRAKVNHRERCQRLYERFRFRPAEGRQRMQAYRKRWKIWAISVLTGAVMVIADVPNATAGSASTSSKQYAYSSCTASSCDVPAGSSTLKAVTGVEEINTGSYQPYLKTFKFAFYSPLTFTTTGNGSITSLKADVTVSGCGNIQWYRYDGGSNTTTFGLPDKTYTLTLSNDGSGTIIMASQDASNPPPLPYLHAGAENLDGKNYVAAYAGKASIRNFDSCRVTALQYHIGINGSPTITYTNRESPNQGIQLQYDSGFITGVTQVAIDGGSSGALAPPTDCSWSSPSTKQIDLGTISNVPNSAGQYTMPSTSMSSPPSAIDFRVTCTGGDKSSASAGTVHVFGSAEAVWGSNPSRVLFTGSTTGVDNSVALVFPQMQNKPDDVTVPTTSLSDGFFIFSSSVATQKELWYWTLGKAPDSPTAAYFTSTYSVTPKLANLGAALWGKDYSEDLTATVTYNLVVE